MNSVIKTSDFLIISELNDTLVTFNPIFKDIKSSDACIKSVHTTSANIYGMSKKIEIADALDLYKYTIQCLSKYKNINSARQYYFVIYLFKQINKELSS